MKVSESKGKDKQILKPWQRAEKAVEREDEGDNYWRWGFGSGKEVRRTRA